MEDWNKDKRSARVQVTCHNTHAFVFFSASTSASRGPSCHAALFSSAIPFRSSCSQAMLQQPQAKHAGGAVGGCPGKTSVITTEGENFCNSCQRWKNKRSSTMVFAVLIHSVTARIAALIQSATVLINAEHGRVHRILLASAQRLRLCHCKECLGMARRLNSRIACVHMSETPPTGTQVLFPVSLRTLVPRETRPASPSQRRTDPASRYTHSRCVLMGLIF